MNFERKSKRICQLKIPYYDIYTSVFVIEDGEECILFDCGDSESDVRQYILPALQRLGLTPTILVLSHSHQDHAGGAAALSAAFSDMSIKAADPLRLNDLECKVHKLDTEKKLSPHVKAILLPGHSADCVALYETEEKILLSGDALQQWGIDRWGTGITRGREYQRSLERVAHLRAKRIIASHDYLPLGAEAEGAEAIEEMLSECQETYYDIEDMIYDYPNKSIEELAALYAALYPSRPVVATTTLKALLK